jgi:histidinol dehydrogenase
MTTPPPHRTPRTHRLPRRQPRAALRPASRAPTPDTKVVERIRTAVRDVALSVLLDLTPKLDNRAVDPAQIRVSDREIRAADRSVKPVYLRTIEPIRHPILADCLLTSIDRVT